MRGDSREKGAQYGKNKGRKDRVHNIPGGSEIWRKDLRSRRRPLKSVGWGLQLGGPDWPEDLLLLGQFDRRA